LIASAGQTKKTMRKILFRFLQKFEWIDLILLIPSLVAIWLAL
jgi:hypothetical protein